MVATTFRSSLGLVFFLYIHFSLEKRYWKFFCTILFRTHTQYRRSNVAGVRRNRPLMTIIDVVSHHPLHIFYIFYLFFFFFFLREIVTAFLHLFISSTVSSGVIFSPAFSSVVHHRCYLLFSSPYLNRPKRKKLFFALLKNDDARYKKTRRLT